MSNTGVATCSRCYAGSESGVDYPGGSRGDGASTGPGRLQPSLGGEFNLGNSLVRQLGTATAGRRVISRRLRALAGTRGGREA